MCHEFSIVAITSLIPIILIFIKHRSLTRCRWNVFLGVVDLTFR